MEVERQRRNGSTLEAALTRARDSAGLQRSSLFATLAAAMPHMAPAVLTKRTMLAISRAIEDEAAARAERPVFVGSFQDARFWRASCHRWRDLAGGAEATAVLAGFRQSRRNGPLFEVALRPGTPVLREWAVVCDSPTFAACLVGIEQLGPRRTIDAKRVFEALWTVEPLAVRETARAGFALATDRYPAVAAALGSRLQEPVRATYDSIRTATVVTNRIIAYLERYA
jgi:DICT domain-containing protein